MNDKDLYTQILGVEPPWRVSRVEPRLDINELHIHLELDPSVRLLCPVCGREVPGYDKRERRWRHLDTCQYKTILIADVPRVNCPDDGVHQIQVPWSDQKSRYSSLFEAVAISWLKEASITAVSRVLSVSWDALAGIMKRAVARGLARREELFPRRLGVDETSFQKRHEYVTIVSDQDTGQVLHVADDRRQTSLDGFYTGLSTSQLDGIESVSMDMWAAYIGSTMKHVPAASEKIAFDKFHVAKHLGDAVDKVRRREHKALQHEGRDDLKGTRYLWLRNPENLNAQRWADLKALRRSTLQTAVAWSVKELAMSLWRYKTRSWARKAWEQCLFWAKETGLQAVIAVADMLERHLEGILNAIVLKATNGKAEGINSRIQWIKKMACGFRNRDRFRQAIYFHLGGLDLYPTATKRS